MKFFIAAVLIVLLAWVLNKRPTNRLANVGLILIFTGIAGWIAIVCSAAESPQIVMIAWFITKATMILSGLGTVAILGGAMAKASQIISR